MAIHHLVTRRLVSWIVPVGALAAAFMVSGARPQAGAVPQRGQRGQRAGRAGRGRAGAPGDVGVKHEVKDARRRQAVCNDGSPAAFYVQAGKGADRNKWIVFFQGGAGCATDAACTARWTDQHNLMTTSGLPRQTVFGGLLSSQSSENPDFGSFTRVLVHYCSSDAYAGDTERTVAGRTLQFRGHRIVDAVIEDLMDRSVVGTPTLREATDVIVAGSSAGAFGVHNNVDRIAERLSWAKVKGIADSGWVPDVKAFGPGTIDVRPDEPAVLSYWNAQPDASCAAANPQQVARCLRETFVYPYLTTPTFVYADQRDPLFLGTLGVTPPITAAMRAWVLQYGRTVRESLAGVPAAFSPSLGGHTSLTGERFRGAVIDGHSLADTLAAWYFGRPGPVKLIAQPGGAPDRAP
jgi:O-palmitoleoyl-L-serine hydrolase